MKLSPATIAVLKNFAAINQNLQFKAGNVIKTKSRASEIFATATIEEEFPQDFAIYEMGRFISVLSLFAEPELEFTKSAVVIKDQRNSVTYMYADSSLIAGADYEKEIKFPKTLAEFQLKQEDLAKLQKAASVLGQQNITIVGANGELSVVAHDKKNSSSDKFVLVMGTTDVDFEVDLNLKTLTFIPGDYDVIVTEKVVCKFTNAETDIEYLVAGTVTK